MEIIKILVREGFRIALEGLGRAAPGLSVLLEIRPIGVVSGTNTYCGGIISMLSILEGAGLPGVIALVHGRYLLVFFLFVFIYKYLQLICMSCHVHTSIRKVLCTMYLLYPVLISPYKGRSRQGIIVCISVDYLHSTCLQLLLFQDHCFEFSLFTRNPVGLM